MNPIFLKDVYPVRPRVRFKITNYIYQYYRFQFYPLSLCFVLHLWLLTIFIYFLYEVRQWLRPLDLEWHLAGPIYWPMHIYLFQSLKQFVETVSTARGLEISAPAKLAVQHNYSPLGCASVHPAWMKVHWTKGWNSLEIEAFRLKPTKVSFSIICIMPNKLKMFTWITRRTQTQKWHQTQWRN